MVQAIGHELEDIPIILEYSERLTKIVLDLLVEWKDKLISCLTRNHDIFA